MITDGNESKLQSTDSEKSKGEFMFVLDRSGSMDGKRMANANRALIAFLKDLPVKAFFNVISFGSHYEYLYEESQPQSKVGDAIA